MPLRIELDGYVTNLAAFLTALGATADDVANSLRLLNVTGLRDNGILCPITVALAARFPDGPMLFTEHTGVVIGPPGHAPLGRVVLPFAVQDFVADFDSGDYPDLVCGRRDAEWAVRV